MRASIRKNQEFLRFALVGGIGAGYGLVFFIFFGQFAETKFGLGLIGFLAVLTWLPMNFMIQSQFVFRATATWKRFWRHAGSQAVGLALQPTLFLTLIIVFVQVDPNFAFFIAMSITALVTYLMSRRYVFRGRST